MYKRQIVTLDNVIKGLKKTLPERHHHLIPMNEEAIKRGMELIKGVLLYYNIADVMSEQGNRSLQHFSGLDRNMLESSVRELSLIHI